MTTNFITAAGLVVKANEKKKKNLKHNLVTLHIFPIRQNTGTNQKLLIYKIALKINPYRMLKIQDFIKRLPYV